MKKIQIIACFIVASIFCNGQDDPSLKAITQVAKDYFRSDPYNRPFNNFVTHLMNDPTLINKIIHKSTDTTYFYLRGDYKSHNPFFFKAIETQIVLAESPLNSKDTTGQSGIIMTYQLVGYTADGEEGEADVKKEFEKFSRKYLKKFRFNDYSDIKHGNEIAGGIRNYFIFLNSIAPLGVAWQKIGEDQENVFVITLRFYVFNNKAVLPGSPYGP